MYGYLFYQYSGVLQYYSVCNQHQYSQTIQHQILGPAFRNDLLTLPFFLNTLRNHRALLECSVAVAYMVVVVYIGLADMVVVAYIVVAYMVVVAYIVVADMVVVAYIVVAYIVVADIVVADANPPYLSGHVRSFVYLHSKTFLYIIDIFTPMRISLYSPLKIE